MINKLSFGFIFALVALVSPLAQAYDQVEAKRAWVAIAKLEQKNGIPKGLLHSMSLVETGQGLEGKVMPWPYTVGVNSPGMVTFKNGTEALAKLDTYNRLGFAKFDVTVNGETQKKLTLYRAERTLARVDGEVKIRPYHYAKRFKDKQEAVEFVQASLDLGYKNLDVGLMQINWRYHGEKFTNVSQALDPYQNASYAVQYLTKHKQTRDWWGSVGRYHSGTQKHAKRYVKHVWRMYQRLHQIDTTRIG
jgi:hypothetical protein